MKALTIGIILIGQTTIIKTSSTGNIDLSYYYQQQQEKAAIDRTIVEIQKHNTSCEKPDGLKHIECLKHIELFKVLYTAQLRALETELKHDQLFIDTQASIRDRSAWKTLIEDEKASIDRKKREFARLELQEAALQQKLGLTNKGATPTEQQQQQSNCSIQ